MRQRILAYAIAMLIRALPAQTAKELIDDFLDKIEDTFASNQTVLQAIVFVRQVLSIPDDIGGDED